ncbi:hypothetical protein PV325_010036, partial [Microctonus aethiopoides]
DNFSTGISTPRDTGDHMDIQLQDDHSTNDSLVSLNNVKDPTHLPAAHLINDIDENLTPRMEKRNSIHVGQKTRAKTRAGIFLKHMTTKEVRVLIERNNALENREKIKKNPDQCDEDDSDDGDNTGNMNLNHDRRSGLSHELRSITSSEYEMVNPNILNNEDVNENHSNTGSEDLLDKSQSGTSQSKTNDDDDDNDGHNMRFMVFKSSHDSQSIASPQYEVSNPNEDSNPVANEDHVPNSSKYIISVRFDSRKRLLKIDLRKCNRKMERVRGTRKGTFRYRYKGYLYHKDTNSNKKNRRPRYVCASKTAVKPCSVSVIIQKNGEIVMKNGPHTHKKPKRSIKEPANHCMKKVARKFNNSPHKVMNDVFNN